MARLDASPRRDPRRARARRAPARASFGEDHAPSLPVGDQRRHSRARRAARAATCPRRRCARSFARSSRRDCRSSCPSRWRSSGPKGGPGHTAARGRFGSRMGPTSSRPETAADALEEVLAQARGVRGRPVRDVDRGPAAVDHPCADGARSPHRRSARRRLRSPPDEPHGRRSPRSRRSTPRPPTTRSAVASSRRPGRASSVVQVKTPRIACQLAVEEAERGGRRHGGLRRVARARDRPARVRDGDSPRVRHAVTGTRPSGRTGNEATSFVFSVQDAPGLAARRAPDLRRARHPPDEDPEPPRRGRRAGATSSTSRPPATSRTGPSSRRSKRSSG